MSDEPKSAGNDPNDIAGMSRRLQAAAHEIRTPLTGAVAIADILASTHWPDPATQTYVTLLRGAMQQMLAVANDILDFGRLETDLDLGAEAAFSPAALLGAIVGLAGPRADEKGVQLLLVAEDLPDRLAGYPVMIRRAVENLVDNAVKHTQSGHVAVAASIDAGGALRIEVSDTGGGIAAEDLPKLFQPYAQLASGAQAGGTGLGLALVKAAVTRMGGAVGVASGEAPGGTGEGSRFTLTIPVRAAGDVATSDAAGHPADRALAVLLVDDNALNRAVIGTILREFGHRVSFAAEGEAALDAVRGEEFDLVLMDLEMPGIGGQAAMQAIRTLGGKHTATPVVALSAHGESARAATLALGFDGYVAKPVAPRALFAAIEAAAADAQRQPR